MLKTVCLTALALPCLMVSAMAHSEPLSNTNFVMLTFENDVFVGQDGGYTNGTSLSWARSGFPEFSPEIIPGWIHAISHRLYISTMPRKQRAISYSVGQAMQTPSDINVSSLIEDEAPYVGLLQWRASLHAYDDQLADQLSLSLGIVGPASGAQEGQRLVHKIIGSDEPQGWDNQINNELVFRISARRLWRLANVQFDNGTGFDVIGIGALGAGTLRSDVSGGLSFRYGRGLKRSFPNATVLPGREINPLAGHFEDSWSVFVNVLSSYVANDISIDGNTFENSHSVPLEHWQGQAVMGVAFNIGTWAYLVSAVTGTDRHEGQVASNWFGSLSVTYNY